MSVDLERQVRAYAEYLDEILPVVTAGESRPVAVRLAVDRSDRSWIRRPAAIFLAAVVLVLTAAVSLVIFFWDRDLRTDPVIASPSAPDGTANSPMAPQRPAVITLTPAPDQEPVRVSTVIGDFEFVTYQVPEEVHFYRNLVVTPHGAVAVDDGELWWSTDYEAWQIVVTHLDPLRLAVVGEEVAVVEKSGEIRLAWDGHRWTERSRVELPGPIEGQMAFGPRGVVAVAAGGTAIYYSTDGAHFSTAERGPRTDVFEAARYVPPEDRDFGDCRATFGATEARIRTVLATDSGFVALTSAAHPYGEVCAPLLWFSADGNAWDLLASESPFGDLSVVYASEITKRDGRFIAIGEVGGQGREDLRGATWVSDDAVTWEQTEMDFLPRDLEAGEMGWMLAGDAGIEDVWGAWSSMDGLTWDGPFEMPGEFDSGWFPPRFVVGSDTILVTGVVPRILVIGRLQNTG